MVSSGARIVSCGPGGSWNATPPCFAVIGYLTQKGIDPERLYYSNKGELEPVNKCKDGTPCNEEEYRENRRSELKVKW